MKPGPALFVAALVWLLLGGGAFFSPSLFLVWFLMGMALLPFIIVDALILCLLTDRLSVKRELSSSLALGEGSVVRLVLRRGGGPLFPARILLFDLYPPSMKTTPAERPVRTGADTGGIFPVLLDRKALGRGKILVLEYTVIPKERGNWFFPGLELLLISKLCFWQLKVFHRCVSRGRTYPDFKKLGSGQELRGIMERRGGREIRRRGQGLEFMSLRGYQDGDPIKSIDWRATGRQTAAGRRKFIVREYQEEQDQQILFILDSGYRLLPARFDSALNGVLLLAYVALKHGDAVAVSSFGAADRWIPPRKGISAFAGLMNGLYDLQSAPVPSSLFSALEQALARLSRRTFIILVSNFREEDGESLSWILPRIRRRHLLLLVSFREAEAEALARGPHDGKVRSAEEVLETAATRLYLESRRRLYRSWEHLGILTMETTCEQISAALINRYLSVKRSGRL
ncbi:MAG: DUF58 domain-containing protein [Treponema sp.]|jgi:uncharacterized protein (DUF58 family)|nr:DUF58 domain-containing protein [Treponema sp.]